MDIKQTMLALSMLTSYAVAMDNVEKHTAQTVGGVAGAAGLVGVESIYRKLKTGRNFGANNAYYPAGPIGVTDTAEKLARNKFLNEFGWWSLDTQGKKIIEKHLESAESTIINRKVEDLYISHEKKETFMRKHLPKTFMRYAFCRNLVLIWGGMNLYNMYQAAK